MPNVGTAALTIIGSVLVYVLGKIIERAFIEPLNDYRRLVMAIAGALAMHANYWRDTSATETLSSYGTLDEPWRVELSKAVGEASRDLRAKATQLGAYALTENEPESPRSSVGGRMASPCRGCSGWLLVRDWV